MSLSTQQVVDQADGLNGLITIISDPEAYKAKLDELKKHAKEGNDAFEASQENLKQAKQLKTDADLKSNQANQIIQDHEGLSDQLKSEHSAKLQKISDRETSVQSREKAVERLELDMDRLKNGLVAREAKVNSELSAIEKKQALLDEQFTKAQLMKQDYETRVAKVKAAVG